jgi:hypothetical protein
MRSLRGLISNDPKNVAQSKVVQEVNYWICTGTLGVLWGGNYPGRRGSTPMMQCAALRSDHA